MLMLIVLGEVAPYPKFEINVAGTLFPKFLVERSYQVYIGCVELGVRICLPTFFPSYVI
jgi:hypothetical protein